MAHFSNSLATNLHMWDGQMAALENDFQILRYDKRGHGLSEPVEGAYSFDDLIGDVVGLWDHLDIEKTHFVGLSIKGHDGAGDNAEPCQSIKLGGDSQFYG